MKAAMSSSEQPEDPSLFRETPSSRGGRRKGSGKWARAKKVTKTLLVASVDMGDYFANISLSVGELKLKNLTAQRRRK